MRLLTLLFAVRVWAAEDADAIVRRHIEAACLNEPHVHRYTFTEQTDRFNFDKRLEPHRIESETHEVIFVEGLEYRKLVARNGQPLSPREQAQVAKAMAQTAEERRKHSRPDVPGGVMIFSSPFSHHKVDLGSSEELLTLYENRIAGEETVRGHKTWILECSPRPNYTPSNEHEREVLVFGKKFWIDQSEAALVRGIYTVVAEGSFARPGSTLIFDFEKIDSDTWHIISLVLNVATKQRKVFQPDARTEYHMSNFHKFDVQSTITVVQPQ
jgi:hypothetical protein